MNGTPARHRVRSWAGRLVTLSAAVMVFLLVHVQAAAADPASLAPFGQTPPALAWIHLEDSRGISIWDYELSLDRGGVTSPDTFFWSAITDACWGAYRAWCALALWFLNWVMSFDWIHTIAAPLISIGDAMQVVVTQLGVVPTLATIAAIVAVGWMARGRWATGVWELALTLVIAALATGVLAQPVRLLAGDAGLIVKTQQAGLELSAAIDGQSGVSGQTPDQLRRAQTGVLVDTFIRAPTEMINFGSVLDGGRCDTVYTTAVKAGPYGSSADLRNKVGACSPAAKAYADHPTASMAIGSVIFMPAAFIILAMTILLAGSVIAAGCSAMVAALRLIVTLVTGLLPGGARGGLFRAVADTAISLLIIMFTTVFLGVFLLVIQAMFAAGPGQSIPRTFVIVDVILVVGIVIYARQRRQLKAGADRLAQWMAQRPGQGAAASRLPERHAGRLGAAAGGVVRTATSLAQMRATRAVLTSTGAATPRTPRPPSHSAAGAGHTGPRVDVTVDRPRGSAEPPTTGGGSSSPGPRRGLPGRPSGGLRQLGSRKRQVAGTLVRAGTSIALGYATGGASSVVTGTMTTARAGKAAGTVRRVATAARMARAAGATPTSRRPPIPLPATTGTDPTTASTAAARGRGLVIPGTVIASSTRPAPRARRPRDPVIGQPTVGATGRSASTGSSVATPRPVPPRPVRSRPVRRQLPPPPAANRPRPTPAGDAVTATATPPPPPPSTSADTRPDPADHARRATGRDRT